MKKVYLLETKTSSESLEFGGTFWKRTILDPQLSLYLPAIRTLGYDPLGAVYDCLLKPLQKPSTVSTLDENGIEIVLDSSGQRVRTKVRGKVDHEESKRCDHSDNLE